MAIGKLEVQRIMERLGKLESQVASLNFKMQAMEKMLAPDSIVRKFREGEADEKRKAEKGDLMVSTDLLKGTNPPKSP